MPWSCTSVAILVALETRSALLEMVESVNALKRHIYSETRKFTALISGESFHPDKAIVETKKLDTPLEACSHGKLGDRRDVVPQIERHAVSSIHKHCDAAIPIKSSPKESESVMHPAR